MLSNSLAFKRSVASKTNVHRGNNELAHKYLD
jgi:hypothetical protein